MRYGSLEYKDWEIAPRPQRDERLAGYFIFPDKAEITFEGLSDAQVVKLCDYLNYELKNHLRQPITRGQKNCAAIIARLEKKESNAPRILPREGYALLVEQKRISVSAEDYAGLFYGITTLIQLAAAGKLEEPAGAIPCRRILDYPRFPYRSVMLDLGRAPFSREFLRRLIRILSGLKFNALRLHLHDNELNGVRYADSSLGSENPFALEMGDYEELIRYAGEHCMEIVPELESWGHAGSILQHYPHLYGASRGHGHGHAFGVGPETMKLLEMLYDQWMDILPDGSKLHVGLDEANWMLLEGASPEVYNRDTLVRHIYDLIQKRAAAHKKDIRMMMYGEPKLGTTVPPDLREKIILEPWWYQAQTDKVPELINTVKTRGPANKAQFVCGAGMSSLHEHGALIATEQWARLASPLANCIGLDIMLWGSNNVHEHFIGIFGGSHLCWNPQNWETLEVNAAVYEYRLSQLMNMMRTWLELLPAAGPGELREAQGPEVLMGRYRTGQNIGQEVVPKWRPKELRFEKHPV